MSRPTRFVRHGAIIALLIGALARADEAALPPTPRPPPGDLCRSFVLHGEIQPPLSAMEKRLICGDPTNGGGKAEGWQTIPVDQAIYTLKNVLQSRGYLHASVRKQESIVVVEPGPLVRAASIRAEGGPPAFDINRRRGILGKALTPDLLDSVEKWSRDRLSQEGFPCAQVKAAGSPETGAILVHIETGAPLFVDRIDSKTQAGELNPEILRRFDAFNLGSLYSSEKLAISADRAITDGVIERTFFAPICPPSSKTVLQSTVVGPPRVYTLGVSIDTEQIGIVSASIKRVRIGENASSATLLGLASFKIQQLEGFYDWKPVTSSSPIVIRPMIEARHRNEDPYEVYSERGFLGYEDHWDGDAMGYTLSTGPQVEYFQARRGYGAFHPHALGVNVEAKAISHEYEFNRSQIVGGSRVLFDLTASDRDFESTFGATLLHLEGEKILNIGSYDPPILLIDIRGGAFLTLVQGGPAARAQLPPDDQQFLGGEETLRGFGRLELPSSTGGYGGLSAAFGTFELRPDLLSPDFTPVFFVDVGAIGTDGYAPTQPIYWSPGAGIIWRSPIGPWHATLAHGFVETRDPTLPSFSHWQFFLSLGEPL